MASVQTAVTAEPLDQFQQQLDITLDSLGNASGHLLQSNRDAAADELQSASTGASGLIALNASPEMTNALGKSTRAFQKGVAKFSSAIIRSAALAANPVVPDAAVMTSLLKANSSGRKLKKLLIRAPDAGDLLILEELKTGSSGFYAPGQHVSFRVHKSLPDQVYVSINNNGDVVAVDSVTWTDATDFYATMGPDPGSAVLTVSAGSKASSLPLANKGQGGKKSTVPPAAPTNLTATATSLSTISLTWVDNATTETGFKIERALSIGGPWTPIAIVGANVSAIGSTGLVPSTTYFYQVRSYNTAGNSTYSNPANATTPAASDTTAPMIPAGLTAVAASASQIDLNWTASTDTGGSGLAGYNIYREGENIATTTATIFSDTGRSPNSELCYTVVAYDNANNNSAQSAAVCATTSDILPVAPSALTATAASPNQINLTWTDNASNETGFKIERADALAGPFSQIAMVGAGTTTHQNTGLLALTKYYYRVRSSNGVGDSDYTATASATTPVTPDTSAPSVPIGLSASAGSAGEINLNWTASTDAGGSGLAGYNIYREGVIIGTTTAATFSDADCSPSTQYCYTVVARDNAGNTSAQSEQSCASTLDLIPSVPSNLQATSVSTNRINLSWTDNSNNEAGFGVDRYDGVAWAQIATVTANVTTYSDLGLQPSKTYTYRVWAYNSAGNSPSSPTDSATTPELPDTTPPSMPTGVSASAISSNQISLSWNASTDTGGTGLAGYKVFRDGVQTATTVATSYLNNGLAGNTQYCYTIAAYDNAGNASTQTSQSCATTPTSPDTSAPSVTLAAPTNGGVVSYSIGVAASATDNVGVTRVEFYRDSGVILGTNTAAPYSLTFDTKTIANGTHTFYAKAYDAAGNAGTSAGNVVTVNNTISETNAATQLVGFVPSVGVAHQVVVTNNLAYVASDTFGLAVIDVTTPSAPAMLGSANVPFDGGSVAVRGSIACVTGQRLYYVPMGQPNAGSLTNLFGFYVYDVSVPTNCVLLGKIESATIGFKGVAISGNYAYVACGGSGVKVIDLSNTSAPTVVGTGYDTPGWANTVAINGSYAYVADSSQGLRILNVSNPLAPTNAGWVDTPGTANSVTLAGNYAYVSDLSSLQIIDVSNPTLPVMRGVFTTATTGGSFVEARVVGTVAHVAANGAGLLTLDVSNPLIPVKLGSLISAPNGSVGVDAQGSYVYLANQDAGLSIVNVTNSLSLVKAGSLSEWFQANYLAGKPGIAVVTGLHAWDGGHSSANGLRVINTSNYKAPKIIGGLDSTAIGFNGLSVTGNYAYVACGASGLKVVDISNPAAPVIVGTGSDTPGWANGVTVDGSYAYVANGSQGLRIINISNPLAPTPTGFVDTPGTAYAVTVVGNTAYVADSSSLQIIDVSNKAAPVIRGSFTTATTGGTMLDVRVAGTTAYVAGNGAGLIILNVSNPAVPSFLSQITTGPNGTIGVSVSGTKVYVANQDYGVTTINAANPSVPVAGASVLSIGSVRNLMLDGNWLCSSDTLGSIDTIEVSP